MIEVQQCLTRKEEKPLQKLLLPLAFDNPAFHFREHANVVPSIVIQSARPRLTLHAMSVFKASKSCESTMFHSEREATGADASIPREAASLFKPFTHSRT